MSRFAVFVVVVVVGLTAAVWYSRENTIRTVGVPTPAVNPDAWMNTLRSQNPHESAESARQLTERGAAAVPAIRTALEDPRADGARRKAALKGCALLGPACAPALDAVVSGLTDQELTAEAALALSFMGPTAFSPLRDSLTSDDPVVRREALRSIGKLKERAALDAGMVVPLLIDHATDDDPGVRAVSATYIGIIHEGGLRAVSALVAGLEDPEADVRRASATALGSFASAAKQALPALRKAARDADENVAREAELAMVKLQPRK